MTLEYGAVLSVVNANDPIQRVKSFGRNYTKVCPDILSPDDCILLPCCVRYIAVFAPNVDWPFMAVCVPPGKHYPRVAHEEAKYAAAFNVTVGSSWLRQKSFFFLPSGQRDFSKAPQT